MLLNKTDCRTADGHDQIELAVDKKSLQIIGKRSLFNVTGTRGGKRSLVKVNAFRRLPKQFIAKGPSVLAPRHKIAAERMQDQDPFRLRVRRTSHGEKQHHRAEKYPANHAFTTPFTRI